MDGLESGCCLFGVNPNNDKSIATQEFTGRFPWHENGATVVGIFGLY